MDGHANSGGFLISTINGLDYVSDFGTLSTVPTNITASTIIHYYYKPKVFIKGKSHIPFKIVRSKGAVYRLLFLPLTRGIPNEIPEGGGVVPI